MLRPINPLVLNVLISKITKTVWPDGLYSEMNIFSDRFLGQEIDIYELVFVLNLSKVFIVKSAFLIIKWDSYKRLI